MTQETDTRTTPLAVYRILPPFRDGLRAVLVHSEQLIRWQLGGDPADFPERVKADWQGPPGWEEIDYPSSSVEAPVLSRHVADRVRDRFTPGGRFLPVDLPGAPQGAYELYVPLHVVDCLDPEKSSPPTEPTGLIERAVFRPEALPLHLPAFRIPAFPHGIYWNGWAVDLLRELIGEDNLELRLVWSTDPDAPVHPNPMFI